MSELLSLQIINRDGNLLKVDDKEEALEIVRHSTSHLMALAVSELFPEVHLGIGPPTAEGFYYDFQTSHRFTEEDLPKIEDKMRELMSLDLPYEPAILSQEEALQLFQNHGEKLKVELIQDREGEVLSCYKLAGMMDFCILDIGFRKQIIVLLL